MWRRLTGRKDHSSGPSVRRSDRHGVLVVRSVLNTLVCLLTYQGRMRIYDLLKEIQDLLTS